MTNGIKKSATSEREYQVKKIKRIQTILKPIK